MSVMDTPYNLTRLGSSDSILKVIQYANDATNGILIGFMIFAIYFAILMILSRYPFEHRLLVANFICFVFSVFLTFAGLLTYYIPIVFMLLLALTAAYTTFLGN